jgi:ribosomal protein RSM22 (predicted rRNA methylase)
VAQPEDSDIGHDDDFEVMEESASGEVLSPPDAEEQVDGSEEEYEEEEEDEELGEDDDSVADVGSGWARIVRSPVRRGRRTILDLCMATEKDGSRGEITRVVCSRRGHAAPLHPQARKSRWGDLWPC